MWKIRAAKVWVLAGFCCAISLKLKAEPISSRVLVAPYSGIISPVSAEFISSAISRAEENHYNALVLRLDTPGGLDTSMRQIVKAIMASKVPVIVYVSPAGARAASAGVFITLSAHVAAMAPGTNIGAAHPVMLPTSAGSSMDPSKNAEGKDAVLEGKMVNDAAAYLRALAHERGRNEDWAFNAVTKSSSIPAAEAVRLHVVDLIAPTTEELLKAIDGRPSAIAGMTLRTAGAAIDNFEMTRRQRILVTLSDPNVAMILMSLGAAGLLIELYNPGLILPGIVGAISLIMAFYSFQTLSANYAGVLLLLFGMVLFLLEIKVTSYGLLALGGITATFLGALMLFQKQSMGGLGVSWSILGSSVAGMLAATGLCSYLVYKASRLRPTTGVEAMIGSRGLAKTELSPRGKVQIRGEIWDAVCAGEPIAADRPVIVEAVDGLTLKVRNI